MSARLLALGSIATLAMSMPLAQAATINVTSTAAGQSPGDGACTLQEAFANVNAVADTTLGDCAGGNGVGDTIVLAERQTYVLTGPMTGEDGASAITIRRSVSVDGRDSIIEAGTGVSNLRIALVSAGLAQLESITLRKGSVTGSGGGILVSENASLSVSKATISGNAASESGGGIANLGSVTVDRSTLSGNRASRGGGLLTFGSALIRNSTVSGNSARMSFFSSGECGLGTGGGIASCSGSQLTLTDSTVTANEAGSGGGIAVAGTVVLRRNLISGNANPGFAAAGASEAITTAGGSFDLSHNVFGHSGESTAAAFRGFGAQETDLTLFSDGKLPTALAQLIAPVLADNGGPTATHALLEGSPALDITASDCPAVDQRGASRPVGAGCDAGAFEGAIAGARIVVNSTADQILAGDGACTLKEAVSNANARSDTTGGDCAAGFNPTIVLGEAQRYTMSTAMAGDCCSALIFTHGVRVEGHGSTLHRDPTLSSDLRLLLARSSIEGEIVIEDLTISGGRASGGGIFVQGGASLRLNRCTVRDNTAGSGRLGGGLRNQGYTTIENSTFTGNSGGGAAVHSSEGGGAGNVVRIVNSTFSGNTGDYLAEDGVTMIHERGGAIAFLGQFGGELTVLSSTVTNNSATLGGGGLYLRYGPAIRGGSSPRVALGRNIIAGNRSLSAGSELLSVSSNGTGRAPIFTLDRNVFGDSSEAAAQAIAGFADNGFFATVPFTVGATDISAYSDGSQPTPLDGILDPALVDNGGPTLTHALRQTSPAVDRGADCPLLDQRGVTRPVDGDDDGSAVCDLGAVEARIADLSVQAAASPSRVLAGNASTLTFTIHNAGPFASSGSRLQLTLPAGLTVTGSRIGLPGAACGAPSGGTVQCTLGDLANQAGGDVELTVLTDATLDSGTLRITATLLPGADFDLDTRFDRDDAVLIVDARDAIPDAFGFPGKTGVQRGVIVVSAPVLVTGTTIAAPVAISGGEYAIGCNAAAFTAAPGSIDPGASVCVRHTSASGFSGDTVTTLTIGGVAGSFTTTTLARDITPDAFSFQPVGDAALDALQTSNTVTITGINDSAPFSVQGGRAGLNGGPCTAVNGTLRAGTNVVVCHVASPRFGSATTTTLTVGASGVLTGVSADFTSTTLSAPVATLTPASLAFAGQRVGTTSAAQTTTLRNTGGAALAISAIDSSNAAFTVTHDCPTALARDASCTISTRFAPGSTGRFDGQVTVASNDPRGVQVATVSGTGIAPLLAVDATTVAFGSQRVGQPGSLRTVTVRNPGSDVLALTSIAVTGPGFARDGGSCGSLLAAGGSCTIGLRFAPGVSGAAAGSLAIGSDGGAATVSLSGTGTAPALSLSERSLSFGRAGVIRFGEIRVGQTSQPQTITATNTGTAPLAISSIRTTGDFVQTTTCGKTLAINASCTISLRFKPSTPGDRSGETVITSDALTSPDRITLSGRGVGVAVKR